jgi:hypothetical protein
MSKLAKLSKMVWVRKEPAITCVKRRKSDVTAKFLGQAKYSNDWTHTESAGFRDDTSYLRVEIDSLIGFLQFLESDGGGGTLNVKCPV